MNATPTFSPPFGDVAFEAFPFFGGTASLPSFGDQAGHCNDTMCLYLQLGYALLAADLCFDVPWVLMPSDKTATNLRLYYTTILTPSLYCYGLFHYPGFWWPVFATYIFLFQCPDSYSWSIFLLFTILSYRYYQILTQPHNPNHSRILSHWWTIVVIRIVLLAIIFYGQQHRGCHMGFDFGDHAVGLYNHFFLSGCSNLALS